MRSMYGIVLESINNFPIATLINVIVIILAALVEVIGLGLLLPFLEILLRENINQISSFSKYILNIFKLKEIR